VAPQSELKRTAPDDMLSFFEWEDSLNASKTQSAPGKGRPSKILGDSSEAKTPRKQGGFFLARETTPKGFFFNSPLNN